MTFLGPVHMHPRLRVSFDERFSWKFLYSFLSRTPKERRKAVEELWLVSGVKLSRHHIALASAWLSFIAGKFKEQRTECLPFESRNLFADCYCRLLNSIVFWNLNFYAGTDEQGRVEFGRPDFVEVLDVDSCIDAIICLLKCDRVVLKGYDDSEARKTKRKLKNRIAALIRNYRDLPQPKPTLLLTQEEFWSFFVYVEPDFEKYWDKRMKSGTAVAPLKPISKFAGDNKWKKGSVFNSLL